LHLEKEDLTQTLVCVTFDKNELIPALFGDRDRYLSRIEKRLEVFTCSRGNTLSISGEEENVLKAKTAVENLYNSLEKGGNVDFQEVDAAIRKATFADSQDERSNKSHEFVLKTKKKHITPYTKTQQEYINMLQAKELVFGIGPAGTGKTYLAVAVAVNMFLNKQVDRIILSRPAVDAGEKLGYLPGDLREKVDPYLRPLFDAMHDMLGGEALNKCLENGEIEVAPLAFMRGRTLNNSFIILDEAQNSTPVQMKMFLTRIGEGARVVVTGDPTQIDLPSNQQSGLKDAMIKLKDIPEIGFIHFSEKDIVRHPLTAKIVEAYKDKAKVEA
jgi:phosphate starvation-inducible PhoH-like protein